MEEKTNEKNKFAFHDAVISWACIIWAVLSIGLMIMFSGMNQVTFSIMTLGQLFLIVGLILLSRRKVAGVVVSITGLGCIVLPAINEWAPLFYEGATPFTLLPILLTVAFILIGLAMYIVPGLLEDISERKCKVEVEAECIDYKVEHLKNGEEVYCPIFKYSYKSNEYFIPTNQYRKEKTIEIGTKQTVKINEENPGMMFVPASKASKMLIYIFGTGFLLAGIGMLITVLAEI